MADARVSTIVADTLLPPGIVTHLDDITTYYEGGTLQPLDPARRGSGAAVVVDILDQAVGARRARLWDAIYFGVIHVIPRVKDLGAVISATSYALEVWNADDVAHLGVSYSISGSGGIGLSGGVALPAYWPPFGAYSFQVDIDADGEAIIDGLITFLFPGFSGTDHRVIGFKLTLLPNAPDWTAGPFEETFGYKSSVRTSDDGTEQRRQLMSLPTREISLVALAEDPVQAAELVVRLFNGGRHLFGVPYWADATALGASLSPGATVITVDTTARIFAAGDLIVLWKDARTWQALTIAAGGVTPTTLTVSNPVAGSWSANDTLVIPVLPARLTADAELEHPAPGVAAVRATFRTEPL